MNYLQFLLLQPEPLQCTSHSSGAPQTPRRVHRLSRNLYLFPRTSDHRQRTLRVETAARHLPIRAGGCPGKTDLPVKCHEVPRKCVRHGNGHCPVTIGRPSSRGKGRYSRNAAHLHLLQGWGYSGASVLHLMVIKLESHPQFKSAGTLEITAQSCFTYSSFASNP